ncbi:MAG: curli production assembly protein CsgG [Magnetospirillum sp.]|nr:MAG: curli production assembly protein CsgG [Magnetospirillum sp.]
MIARFRAAGSTAVLLALCACATPNYPKAPVEAAAPPVTQRQAQQAAAAPAADVKLLKRKIAIGRFGNETRYGRTFIRTDSGDPLGKQTSDMLMARLVESGSFLVFERPDLDKLVKEQALTGGGDIVGVDTLILGSLTEFGRSTVTRGGFLSSTKMQKVEAKVEIRLADPHTGHVFFSASGRGESMSEAGEVFGFGSQADYDASLNDKAIGAAISDVMNGLVTKLKERPWRTDILKVEGKRLYISGGTRQGLRVGDQLTVMRPGEQIKSGQNGFTVALPATELATIAVVSQFGDSETNEGSIAEIVSGGLSGQPTAGLFVTERQGG